MAAAIAGVPSQARSAGCRWKPSSYQSASATATPHPRLALPRHAGPDPTRGFLRLRGEERRRGGAGVVVICAGIDGCCCCCWAFQGTTLAPSPAVTDSPANQGQASSPPEPAFALGPVTVPTAPSTPSASPSPEKAADSPAAPTELQNAPSPVTPPKGYNAPPRIEVAPPDPIDEVPAPVAPPQAAVENPTPVLPGTPALLPSVQAPAPSVALNPNPPLVPPPSVNNQPNMPVGSVPPHPPPALPPANDVPPYPPSGSFPAIPPASVPHVNPPIASPVIVQAPRQQAEPPNSKHNNAVPHVNPPIASPVIVQAPRQQAEAPSSEHNNGNTVPPSNISPPPNLKKHHVPHAPPPKESTGQTAPVHKSPVTGSAPATSPLPQNKNMPSIPKNASSVSHAQPSSPSLAPKSAPTSRSHTRGKSNNPKNGANRSIAPSFPPAHSQGPEVSQAPRHAGTKKQNHHAPPPIPQGHPSFPAHPPSASPASSRGPTNGKKRHHISPTLPPIPPLPEPRAPSTHPIWALPPPPPNLDCNSLSCPEPLTDPPAGAPCACVLPIRVGIRLSVDLYSFFPLVSDFAEEVSSGVNMAQRQVRVMGANVAGLPPSPPSAPAGVGDGAFGNNRNARAMKPLGVDVSRHKRKANGSLIAIAVLSTVIALIICCLAAWLLIVRFRSQNDTAQGFPHGVLPKFSRSSGTGHTLLAGAGRYSSPSGPSGSLGSSIATYAGQAKTFKFAEIDKATNGFDDSKVLGEGGFGCVYQGTLEDGTTVAVKVLKRYDGQGEREFLAEVEMLGRLHHRNLVKLLGICVEENARYVAPEYAMTGHLLVKSDVYSYGVVLLELLTGRKPVDMSQPAGQENLVAWARPLLTNVLSLRQAVDPLLGPNVPLDNVAKAAAIASMCVQPEVAHRPSMGEVVQALKLVCSEGDDCLASGRFSLELPMQTTAVYDATGMEAERVLISEIFGSTPVFTPAADSGSFRKQSSSGPLMTGKNRKFWQRLRSLSRGSMSEHGVSPDYETRSQYSGR
nr:unnamed protein product [Digitaria exilis]